MGILSLTLDLVGETNVVPRLLRMYTTDTLSTITAAGYLNENASGLGFTFNQTDVLFAAYSDGGSATLSGQFSLSFATNGVITLVVASNDVVLPTVAGDIATFSNVGGTLTDSGIIATNVMLKNAVNTLTAPGRIIAAKVNGTEATNAVTASGMSGVITTSSLTTAAGSAYSITWTNTYITTTSTILLNIQGGTNAVKTIVMTATPGSGTATLVINNIGPTNALSGTILIGYLVI